MKGCIMHTQKSIWIVLDKYTIKTYLKERWFEKASLS